MFRNRSTFVLISIFNILISVSIYAQENVVEVERSTDKILLEGKPYYIHVVKKGQTLYSISKAYNVSQKEISKENPSVAFGLRTGQALKIPVYEAKPEREIPGETEDYIYHQIETGQTIYSIAKKYDTTVESILDNNHEIKIDDIPTGTIIKVPKKKYHVEEEKFEFSKQEFLFHKIKRKETIYSLSKKYGISESELKKANDGLKEGLKKGQYLRIPVEDELPDTTIQVVKESVEKDSSDIVCKTLPDISGRTIEVALLLPFYLDENSERYYIDSSEVDENGEKIMETIKRDETWVYSRSTYFLDFILGVKIALDSLQREGVSVDLFCFDTEADTAVVKEIIEMNDLSGVDLIIGPVYHYNLSIVSSYAKRFNIPLVSPLSSKGKLVDNNPYLFQIAPPIEAELEEIARYVSSFHEKNIVLIHSGNFRKQDEIITLKRKLFRYFAYRTFFNEVIFKEIVFDDNFVTNDTINSIEHSLSEKNDNLIIIPSGQETFSSEILGRLHSLSEDYSISVLGYPTWAKFRNTELKYYYDLGVKLFTPDYIDYDNKEVINFLRKYRSMYQTEPDQFSYAWKGYDIAYYFISGLARYGDEFINCHKVYDPQLIETDFDFARVNPEGGFINRYFRMLKYTKDNKILDSANSKEQQANLHRVTSTGK